LTTISARGKVGAWSWSARFRSATASPKTRPRGRSTAGSATCKHVRSVTPPHEFEEVAAAILRLKSSRRQDQAWARSIVCVPLPHSEGGQHAEHDPHHHPDPHP